MNYTNHYAEKIAKILRVDKRIISEIEERLNRVTGKIGVFQKIVEENKAVLKNRLSLLGLSENATAEEAYDALISKIEADDLAIFKALQIQGLDHFESAQKVADLAKKLHPLKKGYFLKHEKARQLLMAEPPKKVLMALGYKYVEEMLQKEDLLEVFSALRFLEDQDWLNNKFFKQYETLHPEDFEEREIELKALSPKWAKAAEKFVAKKYHNVSHLKELGVIFVIPLFLGISGETLRLLSLLLHYLNEVSYYSDLFKMFGNDGKEFAGRIISLLRGDVVEKRLPEMPIEVKRPRFLIIQRYLAKDDENDWRLFEPHINPEALHWQKAEEELQLIGSKLPTFSNNLQFWSGLGAVGDFFKTDTGVDVLVSFNLVDTVMALVKQRELIKYLYHQQEATWNKIFMEYFSLEELQEYARNYILQGWFEV